MLFDNQDKMIDSRDIIERIEELENQDVLSVSDKEELDMLREFAEECEQYSSDWEYGETLIREDYFEQYMDEMIEDCYELPKGLPYWMTITYDYDALQQDYAGVEFDGAKYFIRSC